MNSIIKNKKPLLIIFGAFSFFAFLLVTKLRFYGGFIPDWDESHHLKMGFYFYNAFQFHNWTWLKNLFTQSGQIYPPIYHLLIAVGYKTLGISQNVGIFANIPFILILMLSIYGIGVNLGNKKVGLFTALLTPILPVFLALQERAAIDYASISIFMASFYLLLKTDRFTNKKYSVFFGISIFLGLLVKWPFVIPSIPFIFYACFSLYNQRNKRGSVFKNIGIALLISLPALTWYFYNYPYMVSSLSFYWNPNGFPQLLWTNPHGLTLQNIFHYLYFVPVESAGVGILVLLFFYISIFLPKSNQKLNYLMASVLITYLVLTYLDDKSEFYIAYTYPQLMLITIFALVNIKNTLLSKIALVTLTILILTNFVLTQFNYLIYKRVSIKTATMTIPIFPNYNTKFIYGNWPTKAIIEKVSKNTNCKNGVLIFADTRFVNVANIGYFLALNGVKYSADAAYNFYNPAHDSSFDLNILNTYNCIISKTGYPGLFANISVVNNVNNYLNSDSKYKLTTFNAPDNSSILLYIKK